MINQWRDSIVAFGDPRTTPGGRGKNYTYLTRVEATRDEWLKDKDKQVGQVIKCRTIKNKTAPPRRTGQVDFYFEDANGHLAGDYDTVREVFDLAVLHDIIERKGAWYHFGKRQVEREGRNVEGDEPRRRPWYRRSIPGSGQKCSVWLPRVRRTQLNGAARSRGRDEGVGEAGKKARRKEERRAAARFWLRLAKAERRARREGHPVGGEADIRHVDLSKASDLERPEEERHPQRGDASAGPAGSVTSTSS